ncbi:hypothetical protein KY332_01235 [Candidatus Woesearchaeota archaeon]|nr:hypothetical protein [Candidatus Woesearchaeota archaeon]
MEKSNISSVVATEENRTLRYYKGIVHLKGDPREATHYGPYNTEEEVKEAVLGCINNPFKEMGFAYKIGALMSGEDIGDLVLGTKEKKVNSNLDVMIICYEQGVSEGFKINLKEFEKLDECIYDGMRCPILKGMAGFYINNREIDIYVCGFDSVEKKPNPYHSWDNIIHSMHSNHFGLSENDLLGLMLIKYIRETGKYGDYSDAKRIDTCSHPSGGVPKIVTYLSNELIEPVIRNRGLEVKELVNLENWHFGNCDNWKEVGWKVESRKIDI